MIACITHDPETGRSLVLCYDGNHVIQIRPRDPHEIGWEDYQEAYNALWQVYPNADLIGPENWYLSIAVDLKRGDTEV